MPKLNKTLVDKTTSGDQDIILRDSEIKGFMCKVTPAGRKVYLLYYRTKDGRERRPAIGKHGDITCEQAREIAKQWLAEVMQGGDPSGNRQGLRESVNVKGLWELYRDAKRNHLKPSSLKELTRLWEKYIIPELGKVKALQLDTQVIRRFHDQNIHRPYTANRMLEALRAAYNHVIENKLLPLQQNPCMGIRKYKEKKRERFLSMKEMATLGTVLAECETIGVVNPNVITLIRLLLLTGCRLSEILTLKWGYIDYEQSALRFPDSKTGAKSVCVSAAVLEVLHGVPRVEGNPYVITGNAQEGNMAAPQKAWRGIRAKAGLDDVRLHDLRHSYASVAASGGASLPIIGALLGHSQTQTTERYAHLTNDPVKQAADAVGNKISAALTGGQAEIIDLKPHKRPASQ
jgi:integrase